MRCITQPMLKIKKLGTKVDVVAHPCNTSNVGDGGRRIMSSKSSSAT